MHRVLASLQAWAGRFHRPPPAWNDGLPATPEAAAAPPWPAEVAHILVAEDSPAQRRLLGAYLGRAGYRVSAADSGVAAVARVARGGIDLVLMDLRMPGIDGLAATRRIRALPPPAGTVPILAVTSESGPSDRKRCLATGMTGFLAKPVDRDGLLTAVEAALAGSAAAGRSAAA